MRSLGVVSPAPLLNGAPGIVERDEGMLVKAFFAQAAVKRFDECVLNGLAGLDELQLDVVVLSPLIKHATGEFGTVVDLDRSRQPASEPQTFQHPFLPVHQ